MQKEAIANFAIILKESLAAFGPMAFIPKSSLSNNISI